MRPIPVTTSATPMILIGKKSQYHPGGQWINSHKLDDP